MSFFELYGHRSQIVFRGDFHSGFEKWYIFVSPLNPLPESFAIRSGHWNFFCLSDCLHGISPQKTAVPKSINFRFATVVDLLLHIFGVIVDISCGISHSRLLIVRVVV